MCINLNRSSSVGDKGGIHIPLYLAELSHNPFYGCPPSKEDAGTLQIQFSQGVYDGFFFSDENLAYKGA